MKDNVTGNNSWIN